MDSPFAGRRHADRLPTELWELVLEQLDVQHLVQCKQLCRRVRDIVEYMLRRYGLRLAECAMVDGKDSSMPLRVRLNMLRRYSRAWHTMSAPFERGKDAIYPLSSHIHSMPAPLFLPSGWLSIVDVDLGLLFVRTPALSIPNGPRTDLAWHVAGQLKPSLLPSYVAYRFDPSQDLLILMSDSQDGRHPDIHVRSLSTGLQHPRAAQAMLEKSDEGIAELSSFRVHENLCAILARSDDNDGERTLHIWDWTTGDLLFMESGYHAWGDVIAFLGQRTVLIAHDECLQTHTFGPEGQLRTNTLEFPRFQQDALQVWTTVSQPYAQPEPGRGFGCDPKSEIVVVNMVRSRPPGIEDDPGYGWQDPQNLQPKSSVLLVIRVASLLEVLQADHSTYSRASSPSSPSSSPSSPSRASSSHSTTSSTTSDSSDSEDEDGPEDEEDAYEQSFQRFAFAWDDWGPAHSRFFEMPETCLWEAPSTFGSRALIPYHHDGVPTVAVLDFDCPVPASSSGKDDASGVGHEEIRKARIVGTGLGTCTGTAREGAGAGGWVEETYEAPVTEDFSRWFEAEDKMVRTEIPCRLRWRRLEDLPARLVGAALYENGFVLKIADTHQCDYMAMPLVT